MKFIYKFCLLYTNNNKKNLGVISLKTNNIFILINNIFAVIKEKKLKKAKILAKNRKKLIFNIFIKFNRGYITLTAKIVSFLAKKTVSMLIFGSI